jgi:hypothetical protein
MQRLIIFPIILGLFVSCFGFGQTSISMNIDVTVETQKELFPAIAKFLSGGDNNFNIPGLCKWKIKNNNNESVKLSITADIPEWTTPVINTVSLSPNELKEFTQTPFGIKLLNNHSSMPASVLLKVKVDDNTIFKETRKLNIRACDDMLWSMYSPFDAVYLIAGWVTPNDEMVERVLSIAKGKLLEKSLAGYNNSDVKSEIKAIFNAVRDYKVSYVSSTQSFGNIGFTQRVRLPRESIKMNSANCIDGAVMFASLFENVGLEPLIVILPNHAFIGVRLAPNSQNALFIETTMVGRSVLNSIFTLESTFDAAVKKGGEEFNAVMQQNPKSLQIVDIKKARSLGIYPIW